MIEGDGLVLRPWRESDVDALVKLANDPLIEQFQPGFPAPYTRDDAQWWITEGSRQPGGWAFAITSGESGELLGGCGAGTVHLVRKQAEVGYWMGEPARGKGVATAATRLMADWLFANHELERLELLTALDNPRSQRVALKAGFAREGVRRAAGIKRDGSRQDMVAFVRLIDDPIGPIARVIPDFPDRRLSDGVIVLRPIGPDDVDTFDALMNDPDVMATTVGPRRGREFAERRCQTAESEWLAGNRADCMILDAVTGEPLGDIGFYYRDPFIGQGMIGYGLFPQARGKGYATRAAKLLTDWVFQEMDIARVIAGTIPENEASQRVLMRAGFEREAYLKARLPAPDGTLLDDVQFVRINPRRA